MMPSFYSGALPGQMPPTPPDYHDFSLVCAGGGRQLPAPNISSYSTQRSNQNLRGSEAWETKPQYMQCNLTTTLRTSFPQENLRHGPSSFGTKTQKPPNAYNGATAPLLPPIKVPDHCSNDYQQHVRSSAPAMAQPKEEKTSGGVAAHLDYEMQEMVDFVSETAQGMYEMYGSRICLADIDISKSVLDSRIRVPSEFRKFVSQVLSSTRLPSSTILLGLHYLARRMTLLSIEGKFLYGSGSVHRMLTTALLLGSKFLDDNTFQNRSWSEVSNIPVNELNMLEVEWLASIKWDMHIHPGDPEGFFLWLQQWQRYQASKANNIDPLVHSFEQTRLTEDVMQRQQSFHQSLSPTDHDTSSYAESSVDKRFRDSSQWAASRFDSWPPLRNQMGYSPPSAPQTVPNTPEWYDSQSGFGFGRAAHQIYPTLKLPASLQIAGIHPPQSGYHTSYAQQYAPYTHGSTCPCGYCLSHHERFFVTPGYGPQSVVG